jgi:hypothetical protein
MEHLKMLGIATAVVMALIALPVDTAAAGPNFCTATESPCKEANRWAAGTELSFSIKSGASAQLTNTAGESIDTCTGSTAKGKLESAEPVTGSIESLSWSGCTFTTTTLKTGKREVRHIAGTSNGTVIADTVTEVTVNTVFLGSCIYGVTSGSSLGDLTEGKPAVFHANAVAHKLTGSKLACPETTNWTATFTLTEPGEKTLSVAAAWPLNTQLFLTMTPKAC